MTFKGEKTPVFVQVDLDGLWTIRGCYGYPEGETFDDDPVFKVGLPLLIKLLKEYDLPATFFIVGRDLTHSEKREAIKEIVADKHEIASHSYSHRLGLSQSEQRELRREIEDSLEVMNSCLGLRPQGFRSPGYGVSTKLWEVLAERGFLYDSSLLPTFWTPLLRGITRLFSRRTVTPQFGSIKQGRYPVTPFRIPNLPLWEIPVTVSPHLRLPVQASYSQILGGGWFLRIANYHLRHSLPLVFLLHGIDLVDTSRIEVIPMKNLFAHYFFSVSLRRKLSVIRRILSYLRENFQPFTVSDWLSKVTETRGK